MECQKNKRDTVRADETLQIKGAQSVKINNRQQTTDPEIPANVKKHLCHIYTCVRVHAHMHTHAHTHTKPPQKLF
jgi:hypothetical protein